MKAFTATTITDADALDADFAATRQQGGATNRGEWRAEVYGIAAPIRDATGVAAGALGISGPESRFGPEAIIEWSPVVRAAASAVSGSLGFGAARPMSVQGKEGTRGHV